MLLYINQSELTADLLTANTTTTLNDVLRLFQHIILLQV